MRLRYQKKKKHVYRREWFYTPTTDVWWLFPKLFMANLGYIWVIYLFVQVQLISKCPFLPSNRPKNLRNLCKDFSPSLNTPKFISSICQPKPKSSEYHWKRLHQASIVRGSTFWNIVKRKNLLEVYSFQLIISRRC